MLQYMAASSLSVIQLFILELLNYQKMMLVLEMKCKANVLALTQSTHCNVITDDLGKILVSTF